MELYTEQEVAAKLKVTVRTVQEDGTDFGLAVDVAQEAIARLRTRCAFVARIGGAQ